MSIEEIENLPESTTADYEYIVLALYKFVSPPLGDLPSLQSELERQCRAVHARGCLLIAREGINGTICYPKPTIDDSLLEDLRRKFVGLRYRLSKAPSQVFTRLKIKVKPEIVTLDRSVDPTKVVGTYVSPGPDWNELLLDPETWVIDTRNEYEYRLGTFRNADDPRTQNFREFPEWLKEQAGKRKPPKKIAMFCTGGIRCEKATSMVMVSGLFPQTPVFHLEGGILAYLDTVPAEDSLFDGECYVFDQRTAVSHGLEPSTKYVSCFGCRSPLLRKDRERDDYVEGISCRYCIDDLTDKRQERLEERQRQVYLAAKEGNPHMYDHKERPPVREVL